MFVPFELWNFYRILNLQPTEISAFSKIVCEIMGKVFVHDPTMAFSLPYTNVRHRKKKMNKEARKVNSFAIHKSAH